jgi:nitroreductase
VETLEAILSRRSIRRYTPEPVSDPVIAEILRAAMSAPSAGNQQPWQFVVVADRRLRDEIPTVHPYAQMVREAPVAIVVCGDLRLENYRGYWIQDCSAATQNLLLAAHAKGLGAVWVGIHPREDRIEPVRRLIELPETIVPFALVPVGHPAEAPEQEDRYRPELIHLNKW